MQPGSFEESLVSSLGIALFCILAVSAGCFLIGSASGWFDLGKRFSRHSDPYGETKSVGPFFHTVYLRGWKYSNAISLTAASDALYALILFPFRIGHPSLRIPWEEIQFGQTRWFFRTYLVLTVGKEEKIPMRISRRMARNLGILDRVPT